MTLQLQVNILLKEYANMNWNRRWILNLFGKIDKFVLFDSGRRRRT